ncbi:hypothetical protein Rifp1Sym_ba00070 [endosymbiont of Riftia pachyptila (vent Ph05)]|jgi:hypothetical protein|uniref:Uncharacterized protein n=1 Tax=endosymbiont of Riftia pachyptila (vent Ph05) TaxID=1048808 RepID=G2DCB7_9GAMM|nr:hypothetical protein Rifp1Sym_ba00070 [endosymbiont of Riftia pachyptila (vent Ph05)]
MSFYTDPQYPKKKLDFLPKHLKESKRIAFAEQRL